MTFHSKSAETGLVEKTGIDRTEKKKRIEQNRINREAQNRTALDQSTIR